MLNFGHKGYNMKRYVKKIVLEIVLFMIMGYFSFRCKQFFYKFHTLNLNDTSMKAFSAQICPVLVFF
jgi:hypothetical protein